MVQRPVKPQPFRTALNVLTVDTLDSEDSNDSIIPAAKITSTDSSSIQVPTSFQGFDIKTDPIIRRQAKKSWNDLNDNESDTTPFATQSPFEGLTGNAPCFPAGDQEEEEATGPSPSTPTKTENFGIEEAPLKPGEEDADGAEGFEEENATTSITTSTFNNNSTSVPPVYQNQFNQQAPTGGYSSYNYYYNEQQQQQQQASIPAPRGFQSHNKHPATFSPAPVEVSQLSSAESVSPSTYGLSSRPANYELMGFLPFYKFSESALSTDLPSSEMFGANGSYPKIFLGHVWSRVPSGVVQWLVETFGPQGSAAFGAQLHFNREGWFRGCLHCSVSTMDVHALIHTLHKRVLFDHEGVWFAETADQMRQLDDYCRRLRALPQHVRHNKLQSLPCNPLACEIARNE